MPMRLWFSFGPFHTLTILDIALWLLVAGMAIFSRRITFGHNILFGALCIPVLVAMVSLIWSEDPLSTVKVILYSLTGVWGYLVVVNLLHRCSARFIGMCMGLFVVVAVSIAILYWLRIPFVWSVLGVSLEDFSSLDPLGYASEFARLNSPYLGKSNDFGTVLALYVPFFAGIAGITSRKRYAIFAFVAAMGVLLTLSRGVILSTVGVLALALAVHFSFRNFTITVLAAGLLILPVIWFTARVEQTGIDVIDLRLNDQSNIKARFDRFTFALDEIAQSPLLGRGGGRYVSKEGSNIDSAFHNTYLEQWASYGLVFGTVCILALIALVWCLFQYTKNQGSVRTVARFAGLSVLSFLIICTNQTSNESAIPSLMLRLFLGYAVAYLLAFRREQSHIRPRQ
jgi:O-antigen ligase